MGNNARGKVLVYNSTAAYQVRVLFLNSKHVLFFWDRIDKKNRQKDNIDCEVPIRCYNECSGGCKGKLT